MKKLTPVKFILAVMIFASCEVKRDSTINSKNNELDSIVKKYDSEILDLRGNMNSFKAIYHKELIYSDKDTLKTNLYLGRNEIPKILEYIIIDDGGDTSDNGYYYFNDKGRVFANHILVNSDEVYFRLFLGNNKVVLYSKKNSSYLNIVKCDSICMTSKNTITAKEVATYMQFFPGYNFSMPTPVSDGLPDLRTYTDSVVLMELPNINSKMIRKLKENTHLEYLGASSNQDSVNGKVWVWYKVETTKGKKGWVFGHPKFIHDLNDENWETPAED